MAPYECQGARVHINSPATTATTATTRTDPKGNGRDQNRTETTPAIPTAGCQGINTPSAVQNPQKRLTWSMESHVRYVAKKALLVS